MSKLKISSYNIVANYFASDHAMIGGEVLIGDSINTENPEDNDLA